MRKVSPSCSEPEKAFLLKRSESLRDSETDLPPPYVMVDFVKTEISAEPAPYRPAVSLP
jgi:hypothetical protein